MPARGPLARIKRAAIVAAMSAVTLNVWTGAPLAGLWVGSRLAGDQGISLLSIAGVAVTIGVLAYVLVRLLARLQMTHERLMGSRPSVRQQLPWMRSMRGERPHEAGPRGPALTVLDVVLVLSVVLCVSAFEVWFFFYSGSPIDQRSGR